MRTRHVLLSIASGLLLALALPKPGIWPLAWIGLVPLLVALRDVRPARAALYGLITGLVYYGIVLYWIMLFGGLPWALLVIYQALYIAAFAALSSRLLPQRTGWLGYIAIAAAWTVLQYVRTLGAYAFIWGNLAHSQANNLVVAQLASITGIWGIEFLVCLVNLTLAGVIVPYSDKRRYAAGVIVGLILVGVCIFGYTSLHRTESRGSARVAIIQGNMKNDFHPVPNYTDRAYSIYSTMSLQAAGKDPSIIIWPETALPVNIMNPGWGRLLESLAGQAKTDLLVGGYDPSTDPSKFGSYNALHLYNREGRKAGVYRKVQLVPFGEFVPLRKQLPFLKDYGIRPDDVLPAKEHALLNPSIGKIGVSICFESLFPEIARSETRRGANALVVVTNDAWFQHTTAARQHEMMARLRAIENRRYVLRAAGTGISAIIDPCGRTQCELGMFRRGVVSGEVSPRQDLTIYTRFGPYFAYACMVVVLASLAVTSRRRP